MKGIACLFLGLFANTALAADAESFECKNGELARRVVIEYLESGKTVPCSVKYYKDTEAPGEVKELWSAAAEDGFCEKKTVEFIEKLKGWGWNCSQPTTVSSSNGQ